MIPNPLSEKEQYRDSVHGSLSNISNRDNKLVADQLKESKYSNGYFRRKVLGSWNKNEKGWFSCGILVILISINNRSHSSVGFWGAKQFYSHGKSKSFIQNPGHAGDTPTFLPTHGKIFLA